MLLEVSFSTIVGMVNKLTLSPGFQRICFYSGSEPPPFLSSDVYTFARLTKENFKSVLHATSSVPFFCQPCTNIPGFGEGNFVDGGVYDYILNFKNDMSDYPALLLNDTPTIHPTYFDSLSPLEWFRESKSSIFNFFSSFTNSSSATTKPDLDEKEKFINEVSDRIISESPKTTTTTTTTTNDSIQPSEVHHMLEEEIERNTVGSGIGSRGGISEEEAIETTALLLHNCSVLHPTSEFLDRIGSNALPAFGDWFHIPYMRQPQRRILFWKAARDRSIDEWPTDLYPLAQEHLPSHQHQHQHQCQHQHNHHYRQTSLLLEVLKEEAGRSDYEPAAVAIR